MALSKQATIELPDNRMQTALGMAVALHLALAFLLPDIPELAIPTIDRGSAISVFLRVTPEPQQFEQNLNNPGELSDRLPDEQTPAGVIPRTQTGDTEALTDPAPEVQSERQDFTESSAGGQQTTAGLAPSVFITTSMIRLFAQEEAYLQAEKNPQAVERFNRSFRSRASVRQRPRTEDFRDIYGDYYVRNSASDGDVCFMQQKEQQPDDFSLNTVYFFRCGEQPLNLELPSSN